MVCSGSSLGPLTVSRLPSDDAMLTIESLPTGVHRAVGLDGGSIIERLIGRPR
jgi:hypothetical protein